MRYECLLFDADRTILDYDAAEEQALAAALAELGVQATKEHIHAYREINARVWEAYERREISQWELGERRFSELFARCGVKGDAGLFGERYLELLSEGAQLITGARALLGTLHGKVRMVLVTNGIAAVQLSRLGRSDLEEYFDALVISGELDVAKPDPRIFSIALQRAGSPPHERVLMIGDSLSSDILGAVRVGLDSCWLNPRGEENPFPFSPTYEIRALSELLAIVDLDAQ